MFYKKKLQSALLLSFLVPHLNFANISFKENHFANHLYFILQKGQVHRAIQLYKDNHQSKTHDLELLQQIGLGLLQAGIRSKDPEIMQLSLLGAGISLNEKTQAILEVGLSSDNPYHQLVSLSFLSKYQNVHTSKAFDQALRSNYLPIRLEAAFHLCNIKSRTAYGQTESLMNKVPPQLKSLFPQFFAAIGDHAAIKTLKQMMNDPNLDVRIEAILSAVKYQRDELLPMIRILATHHEIAQREVCAMALGFFQDEKSLPILQENSRSKTFTTQLSALYAMYLLGKKESLKQILELAFQGNTFAISLLGKIEGTEDHLSLLLAQKNLDIKINAALALLELKDTRAIKPLCDILFQDSRNLLLQPLITTGKSLHAYKVTSSSSQNFKKEAEQFELDLRLREEILIKCIDLPEEDFIYLITYLFEHEQQDLIPTAVRLLENMHSNEAVRILTKYAQKAGAPLIRNYCNLAMYRMGEQGPYFENLKEWILSWKDVQLIQFRPLEPMIINQNRRSYQMTPEETSRLLIESFESFVQLHDDRGIDILLNAIQNGNNNNKYVLAGLLMRATL